MCSKKLLTYITNYLSSDPFRDKTNISDKHAIKKGFEKTDQYLKLGQLSKESKDVGSTALIAVMTPLKDLIIAYVGDSPAFISSNGLSAQITKEHDLHNKSGVLRLRTQKKHYGLRYSIKRLASNKREKYWESKPEFANQIYNVKYLDLLVLCSDKLACKDLINLCDSISKSGYCTDDISIIIIVFKNGRSFRKWHEDATKNAEDSNVWMNSKTIDEEDLCNISEQDLYKVKPLVKNNIIDIYDTSNQYSAEEAANFANMTVPDL
ncbi:Protein phosphatase 2C family protein [Gigaspora margarita]|uniref:Protein phosphatase 2C family protein n=1 Tax=Gigaspora margarita TaxID=4874 RepID=A0A8H4EGZ6_GIGMA|nr:Protein phosphatase 2C family protein [Gigaspora margarita]